MPKQLNADRELVKSLFVQSLSLAEISRKTGLNKNTLNTWARREKWTELRSKTCEALDQPLQKLAAMTLAESSTAVREALASELRDQVDLLRANPAKNVAALANTPKRQGRAAVVKAVADTASTVHGWANNDGHRSLVNMQILGQIKLENLPDATPAVSVPDECSSPQ